ncbi:MAG: amino acid transport protein [Armatimonadota bacterium]|nr:amino acid transport protein [Armatimonadota bacterium]
MFNTDFLLASLVWGTIGAGCLVYGKKQNAAPALIAGLALIVASFIPSPLLMSGVSLLLLTGMVWAIRQGY